MRWELRTKKRIRYDIPSSPTPRPCCRGLTWFLVQPDIDEDIAALKLEKEEVLEIVKAFEDEERAMVAKSQSGVPAEEEEISDTEIEH